jgi:predicted RNase H-like nuclease (RuvC/YqgF family)
MPNLHKALEALTRLPQTPSQAVNELTASVRAVAADALKTLSQQQADIDALRGELEQERRRVRDLEQALAEASERRWSLTP